MHDIMVVVVVVVAVKQSIMKITVNVRHTTNRLFNCLWACLDHFLIASLKSLDHRKCQVSRHF